MKVQLWDRKNNTTISAEVLPAMTPEQLVHTEGRWQKFRVRARQRRRRVGVPVPEHDHWNWDEKSHDLKFTAYRCLGIGYDDEVQGLMMISMLAVQGRAKAHSGKPVLYIKYIERPLESQGLCRGRSPVWGRRRLLDPRCHRG
jgi:hypothetical protein